MTQRKFDMENSGYTEIQENRTVLRIHSLLVISTICHYITNVFQNSIGDDLILLYSNFDNLLSNNLAICLTHQ